MQKKAIVISILLWIDDDVRIEPVDELSPPTTFEGRS